MTGSKRALNKNKLDEVEREKQTRKCVVEHIIILVC